MPGDEPKAHHYIQCAYLEGFCRPGSPHLWIYSPNRPVRTQSPKECAVENYFYCFDKDGKRSFVIEKMLADVEARSFPVVEAARQGRLPRTATDRLTLAGYIALSMVRMPSSKKIVDQAYLDHQVERLRSLVNTPGELEEYLGEEEMRTGKRRNPGEERRKLKRGKIRAVQTNHAWSLRTMFDQLPIFQERILEMNWTLLKSHSALLTCDYPVIMSNPRKYPINLHPHQIDPDAVFPISHEYCFVASYKPFDSYAELDAEQSEVFNRATIRRASRFVFSPFDAPYISTELDAAHQQRTATAKSDVIQI